ncbi:MAG: ABC transporter permease [Dehalococcoidia bacterium]
MTVDAQTLAQQGLAERPPFAQRIWHETWKFVREYPLGAVGAAITLVLVAMAIAPELFTNQDPNFQVLRDRYGGISWTHWFGQDQLGRDQYTRIIYGARTSIIIGFGVITVTSSLGLSMGIVSGYFGGLFDTVWQRLVDVAIALPGLPFTILLVTALTQVRMELRLVLGVSILISFSTSRIIRSQVLSLKEQPYIEAAQAVGASNIRVMFRHILPNVIPLILVSASTLVGIAILIEAGLSFLGYGVQPPTASWGRALSDAREFMTRAPHLAVFPGLAIFVAVYGFNMLGDAIRDKVDPRLRGTK